MIGEYRQEGKILNYKNPTSDSIPTGTVVIFGSVCGIAATLILPEETGTISMTGVYKLPKDSGKITAGAKVYYDAAADKATTAAETGESESKTANSVLGYAAEEAAAADEYVLVNLNG